MLQIWEMQQHAAVTPLNHWQHAAATIKIHQLSSKLLSRSVAGWHKVRKCISDGNTGPGALSTNKGLRTPRRDTTDLDNQGFGCLPFLSLHPEPPDLLLLVSRVIVRLQGPFSFSDVIDGIQSPCVSPRYLAGSSHCLGTLCKKKSWTKWLYWCLPYRHIGNILLSYSITQPLRQELSSKCMQSRKYLEKGHSFCLTATCRCVKRYKHQVVLPQSCIRCTSCVIKENFKKYIHHVTLMLDIHISRTLSVLKTK